LEQVQDLPPVDSRTGPFWHGMLKAFLQNGPWFHHFINRGSVAFGWHFIYSLSR